jgi:D-psicose/D-tagatose/L-ribulose 3-epimerase
MQLGISSLAWAPDDDAYVAEQALAHALDFVDLAPSKYFGAAWAPRAAQLDGLRRFWESRCLPVRAMQSLLFGTEGLNVFGDAASRAALIAHLGHVAAIGAALGARALVFGSPRNRDRSALDDAAAQEIAVDVFRRAGDAVAGHGLQLCLEPNPARYGCNFMTDVSATAHIVRAVAHPSVRLNFDVGAVLVNGEAPAAALAAAQGLIGHVHLSEPDLLPLGESGADHAIMAGALRRADVAAAAIEVLPAAGRDLRQWLPACLAFATRTYRSPAT